MCNPLRGANLVVSPLIIISFAHTTVSQLFKMNQISDRFRMEEYPIRNAWMASLSKRVANPLTSLECNQNIHRNNVDYISSSTLKHCVTVEVPHCFQLARETLTGKCT